MKENIKLYYSVYKTDTLNFYKLKLDLRKAKLPFELMTWYDAAEQEQKAIAFLLLTYNKQLVAQQKTISDLIDPVMTWVNADGSLDIRVGFEDIREVI
jgi:hypothetical protein